MSSVFYNLTACCNVRLAIYVTRKNMQVLFHFVIYKLPTKTTHTKAAEEYRYGARS